MVTTIKKSQTTMKNGNGCSQLSQMKGRIGPIALESQNGALG
jgi:hypothetical protein